MIIEITNQNSRDSPSYIMQIVPSNCVILLTHHAIRRILGIDNQRLTVLQYLRLVHHASNP